MFAFLCTQNHNEITEFYDSDACVRYGSKIAYQDPMVILCDDVVDEEFKCLQEDYVLGEQNEIKELIRDEAVHDYFTAGIKAEVILDMLLRPVLEKVLSQLLKGKDQGVHFITKEFPIPTKANDN
ncbi:MAG: hypothetical protein K6F00_06445, partial [Lachnospiraceae bacterium]|nr:hypothetical protein [Lachnospiraceae bacterium]